MFDLQESISTAFKTMAADGDIHKMVSDKLKSSIERSVDDAVGSLFRYDGPLKKQIEEVVKEKVKVDFRELDLPSYQSIILEGVRTELNNRVSSVGVEKMKEAVSEMLDSEAPEKVTFEVMMEKFVDEKFRYGMSDDIQGEISLDIDDHGNLVFIRIDEDSDVERYQCEHAITLARIEKTDTFTIHSYERNGRKYNTPVSFGQDKHGFGHYAFKLYSAGTIISGIDSCCVDDLKYYDRSDNY